MTPGPGPAPTARDPRRPRASEPPAPERAGSSRPLRLAVTLGDPRGIGPEVARAAAERFRSEEPGVELALLGSDEPPEGADAAACGRIAAEALEEAVTLALGGAVHGVVTAPLHKPALHAAGRRVPGQTELLQQLTNAPAVGMLMSAERTRVGPPLRVLLATTHVALRDVPARVTEGLLVDQARLLVAGLRRDFGIPDPRTAFCALNPHASDEGLFGDEEARVFLPAIRRLREEGIEVSGPTPADSVFRQCLDGELDAVIAPYHDVGMAAFKTVAFGGGVNVTLGLPFPRTSPDHGTAFALARRGQADASSMLEALRLATRIARCRFDSPATRA